MFGRNNMIENGIKKRLFVLLMFGLALGAWAGGGNQPSLNVRTPSENSRLILLDWSNVKSPERSKYGLYRVNREEKTYAIMLQVNPGITSVLDSELELPLSNYFYKIESVEINKELPGTKPMRIADKEMEAQIASSYFVNDPDTLPEPSVVYANQRTVPSANADTRGTVRTNLPPKPSNATNARYNTNTGAVNDGIYLGAVVFAGQATDLTQNPNGSSAMVLLDPAGRQVLLEHLALGYVPQSSYGTALYYAEHKAIAGLTELEKAGRLPANIDSVSIITFTDGIDTSSTDAAFAPLEGRDFRHSSSGTGYRAYISQQLQSRRIAGKPINAWSIGIRGRDVQNESDFLQTLQSLSSGQGYVANLDDLSGVEENLLAIADGLNVWTPQVDLTISTPAYPVGTTVRLTFDDWVTTPSDAEFFVDARVGWTDNSYILSNIKSSGVALNNVPRLTGRRVSNGVEYVVTVNNEFSAQNIKQWYIQPGEEAMGWQSNSEFSIKKASTIQHERKSALVYLVLDCSSSLKPEEIDRIRRAINVFIDRLYNASSRAVTLPEVGKEAFTNVFYPGKKPDNSYARQLDNYSNRWDAQPPEESMQYQKQQIYSVPSPVVQQRQSPQQVYSVPPPAVQQRQSPQQIYQPPVYQPPAPPPRDAARTL
ncbi:hypothetical protein FACS1894190_14660 [Spirochaetia bacterium]|nr:hypothetical protein FACS1894190_14660 [Spirochaetia bacterium]